MDTFRNIIAGFHKNDIFIRLTHPFTGWLIEVDLHLRFLWRQDFGIRMEEMRSWTQWVTAKVTDEVGSGALRCLLLGEEKQGQLKEQLWEVRMETHLRERYSRVKSLTQTVAALHRRPNYNKRQLLPLTCVHTAVCLILMIGMTDFLMWHETWWALSHAPKPSSQSS